MRLTNFAARLAAINTDKGLVRQINAQVERSRSVYCNHAEERFRVVGARTVKGTLQFRALYPGGGEWIDAPEGYVVDFG